VVACLWASEDATVGTTDMTTEALWERLRVLERERELVIQALREAGEPVRRQRVRIRPDTNERLPLAFQALRAAGDAGLTRVALAETLGISADYAFDLLDALRAEGRAVRVRKGLWVARERDLFLN
jgi:hypothetical protein